jgi:hypothetical protein
MKRRALRRRYGHSLSCRKCGDAVTPRNARRHADELLKDARQFYEVGYENDARDLRAKAATYIALAQGAGR